jgi:hypothetical protein
MTSSSVSPRRGAASSSEARSMSRVKVMLM